MSTKAKQTKTRSTKQAKQTSQTKAKTATQTEQTTPTELEQIQEKYSLDELMTEHKTKSAVIRFLTAEGYKRSPIAKFMGIRYQHVRNVQVQDLAKQAAASKEAQTE